MAQCGFIPGDANIELPPAVLGETSVCSQVLAILPSTVLKLTAASLSSLHRCDHPLCCTATTGAVGSNDTDFILLISASQTPACGGAAGPNGVNGYAVTCRRDSMDRPVAGRINVCPGGVPNTTETHEMEHVVSTVLHEAMHALGFSASSWWRWRDPDTLEPLTAREGLGPAPQYQVVAGDATYDLPSESTLQYFAERGIGLCSSDVEKATPSSCVHKLVTPWATQASRWYFNCSIVQGAELENQPTGATIVGSHLEQRIFEGTLMTAVSRGAAVLDPVSLGIMQDSGWYKVQWEEADPLSGKVFGFQQGCAFALGTCAGPNATAVHLSPPRFSDGSQQTACSVDRRHIVKLSGTKAWPSPLPSHFRYFDDASLGGTLPQADFCPAPNATSGTSCLDPAQPWDPNSGSFYGPNSTCVLSSAAFASPSGPQPVPHCMRFSCGAAAEQASPALSLHFHGSGFTLSAVCAYDGEVVSFGPPVLGTVICPDPEDMCGPGRRFVPPPSPSASPSSSQSPSATPTSSPTSSPSAALPTPSPTASALVPSALPTPSPLSCSCGECVHGQCGCARSSDLARLDPSLLLALEAAGAPAPAASDKVQACVCEDGYTGPTCSLPQVACDSRDTLCGLGSGCSACLLGFPCVSSDQCGDAAAQNATECSAITGRCLMRSSRAGESALHVNVSLWGIDRSTFALAELQGALLQAATKVLALHTNSTDFEVFVARVDEVPLSSSHGLTRRASVRSSPAVFPGRTQVGLLAVGGVAPPAAATQAFFATTQSGFLFRSIAQDSTVNTTLLAVSASAVSGGVNPLQAPGPSAPEAGTTTSARPAHGLSTGAVVGAAVCSLLGVVACVVGVGFVRQRWKKPACWRRDALAEGGRVQPTNVETIAPGSPMPRSPMPGQLPGAIKYV